MPIVAVVGVLASIVLYRALQTGAFKSIQLAPILAQVARRGRLVIDGLYTQDAPATEQITGADATLALAGSTHQIHWPHQEATLQVIDVPR